MFQILKPTFRVAISERKPTFGGDCVSDLNPTFREMFEILKFLEIFDFETYLRGGLFQILKPTFRGEGVSN